MRPDREKRIFDHICAAVEAIVRDDAHEAARLLGIASRLADIARDSIADDARAEWELGASVYADAMNEQAAKRGAP